jgi:hypothetical protein
MGQKNSSRLRSISPMIRRRASKMRCSVPDDLSSQEIQAPVEQVPTLDVQIESPAIRRLIEEVRAEETEVPRSYNRTFNRHNR